MAKAKKSAFCPKLATIFNYGFPSFRLSKLQNFFQDENCDYMNVQKIFFDIFYSFLAFKKFKLVTNYSIYKKKDQKNSKKTPKIPVIQYFW